MKKLSLIEIVSNQEMEFQKLNWNLNQLFYNTKHIANFNDLTDRLITTLQNFGLNITLNDLINLYKIAKQEKDEWEGKVRYPEMPNYTIHYIKKIREQYGIPLREAKIISDNVIPLLNFIKSADLITLFHLRRPQNPIQFYQDLLERSITFGSVELSKKIRELLLIVISFASTVDQLGLKDMKDTINGLAELEREYF